MVVGEAGGWADCRWTWFDGGLVHPEGVMYGRVIVGELS